MKSPLRELKVHSIVLAGHHLNYHRHGPPGILDQGNQDIQCTVYPLHSSLSFDILSIPASSAPIECIFSTAGESNLSKRNRPAH